MKGDFLDEILDLMMQNPDYVKEILRTIFKDYYTKNIDRIVTYKKEGKIIAFENYLAISDGALALIKKYGRDALKTIHDTNGENILVPTVVVDKENRNRNIPLKMTKYLLKLRPKTKTFNWFKDDKLVSFKRR